MNIKSIKGFRKTRQLITYHLILITFTACEKSETAVVAHQSGNITTAAVSMDGTYKYQVFFSLERGKEISKSLKTTWDLAFDNNKSAVYLNGAKAMFAYNTGKTDFVSVTDTFGYKSGYICDMPSGNTDSVAINTKSNTVYIIDLGRNETGAKLGFKKVRITAAGSTYTIQHADLNGNAENTVNINTNILYNRTYFSIINNSETIVEPKKIEYDLVFTQYTHVFYEPDFTPYLVTGVLLNSNNVKVAATNEGIKKFIDISIADTVSFTFSKNANTIGYDWKEYDFNSSTYTVYPDKIYLIRSVNGLYYKLHFIDFYNSSGDKGVPTFEYQQL